MSSANPALAAAPPAFSCGGVHFLHVTDRASGLVLLATARAGGVGSVGNGSGGNGENSPPLLQLPPPSLVLELLRRIALLAADACGALTEERLRANAVLVYELLDEAIDGGLPQPLDGDALADAVLSAPVAPRPSRRAAALAARGREPGGAPGPGPASTPGAPPPVVKSVLDAPAAGVGGGIGGGLSTSSFAGGGGGGSAVAAAAAAAGGFVAAARTSASRDEIFVDVVERVSAIFAPGGALVSGCVDGALKVKSFLRGSPAIAVALSEALVLGGEGESSEDGSAGGRGGASSSSSSSPVVRLDDAAFHERVSLARLESERTLDVASAPRGEASLMTYRSTAAFDLPFACDIRLEQGGGGGGTSSSSSARDDPLRATLTVRLRARFARDRRASGLEVVVPMPSAARVARASAEVSGSLGPDRTSPSPSSRGSLLRGGQQQQQSQQQGQQANALGAAAVGACEWDEAGRRLVWRCSGVPGGAALELRAKITLASPYSPSLRYSVGPVCLRFTVPMVSATGLAVRYLHVGGGGGGSGGGGGGGGGAGVGSLLSGGGGGGGGGSGSSPHRWVRYVTTSDSYVFRLA